MRAEAKTKKETCVTLSDVRDIHTNVIGTLQTQAFGSAIVLFILCVIMRMVHYDGWLLTGCEFVLVGVISIGVQSLRTQMSLSSETVAMKKHYVAIKVGDEKADNGSDEEDE